MKTLQQHVISAVATVSFHSDMTLRYELSQLLFHLLFSWNVLGSPETCMQQDVIPRKDTIVFYKRLLQSFVLSRPGKTRELVEGQPVLLFGSILRIWYLVRGELVYWLRYPQF